MAKTTLILGGARSGKSHLAEKLAHKRATTDAVLYVATLEPYDDEMRQRVSQHRASRPTIWRTLEAPQQLTQPILSSLQNETLVLVDCLTVWSSNRLLAASGMMDSHNHEIGDDLLGGDSQPEMMPISFDTTKLEDELNREISLLIERMLQQQRDLIMVSNEVGLALVPPYPLGRIYRDLLGRLNQHIATQVDEVLLVVAGLPLDLKQLQTEL